MVLIAPIQILNFGMLDPLASLTLGPILFPYGGFLKWGYPQIIHVHGGFHYKPSILGYPHVKKPPYNPNYYPNYPN